MNPKNNPVGTLGDSDNKATEDRNDTSLDDTNQCENGVEGCDHDDFDMMSDDCKADRACAIADARDDTYD